MNFTTQHCTHATRSVVEFCAFHWWWTKLYNPENRKWETSSAQLKNKTKCINSTIGLYWICKFTISTFSWRFGIDGTARLCRSNVSTSADNISYKGLTPSKTILITSSPSKLEKKWKMFGEKRTWKPKYSLDCYRNAITRKYAVKWECFEDEYQITLLVLILFWKHRLALNVLVLTKLSCDSW